MMSRRITLAIAGAIVALLAFGIVLFAATNRERTAAPVTESTTIHGIPRMSAYEAVLTAYEIEAVPQYVLSLGE